MVYSHVLALLTMQCFLSHSFQTAGRFLMKLVNENVTMELKNGTTVTAACLLSHMLAGVHRKAYTNSHHIVFDLRISCLRLNKARHDTFRPALRHCSQMPQRCICSHSASRFHAVIPSLDLDVSDRLAGTPNKQDQNQTCR